MLPKLAVWYNTRCPVCRTGIGRQQRRLRKAAREGAIEFHDINLAPEALAHYGASLEDVRKRLHGVDANGRVYVGGDCAIEMWRRTPGDGWMAALFGLPALRPITRFGYDRFADLLYAWNRRKGHW